MNFIIDPITNIKFSLFTNKGRKLLKLFILQYQNGGYFSCLRPHYFFEQELDEYKYDVNYNKEDETINCLGNTYKKVKELGSGSYGTVYRYKNINKSYDIIAVKVSQVVYDIEHWEDDLSLFKEAIQKRIPEEAEIGKRNNEN